MKRKPLVLRALAEQDIQDAIVYYLAEGAEHASAEFIDALEHVFAQIERRPAIGSPRYAQELDLPGLRSWPMKRFPYLVFYLELTSHIDVWRVLHAKRDIPARIATAE